jgi:hypothetical protein
MQAGVLAISLVALAVSLYGIVDRRGVAHRSERLRFMTLVEDLQRRPDGENAEIPAVQAFLLQRTLHDVTSPEYRTLGAALSRSGYPAEAEQCWREALVEAEDEGPTQVLFAHRGYALFLFAAGRPEEGREHMWLGLKAIGSNDDTARIHRIRTYKYWAAEEETDRAAGLRKKAEQTIMHLENEHARLRMRAYLERADG